MTAMPQPKVITIQPEFWALEWFNSTAATTPSPRRIRIAVPIISAPMMLNETPLLERERGIPARPRGATLGATLFARHLASQRTGSRPSRAGGASCAVRQATPRRAGDAGRAGGGRAGRALGEVAAGAPSGSRPLPRAARRRA